MKTAMSLTSAALLMFALGAVSVAQVPCKPACPRCASYNPRSNVYIRGGAAFPIGDIPDSAVPTGGIGYEKLLKAGGTTLIGFSLDYIPVRSDINGTDVTTLPEIFYFKKTNLFGSCGLYGAAGIGAWWASKEVPEMDFHVDQNFAWMLEVGKDFSHSFFGSARFIAGTDPGKDGVFVTDLGLRF